MVQAAFWGPNPARGHVRPGTPEGSELRQSDVTHRTLADCGHEYHMPWRPPPPESLLPRRSPLKTMAAEAPMTAKKEAYSGPLLSLIHI